jgi:membrane associated rhomboid family serine protease
MVTILLVLLALLASAVSGGDMAFDPLAQSALVHAYHPARVWNGEYYLLLLAPFVHLDLLHLFSCVVSLAVMGSLVEYALGRQFLFATIFFGALAGSGMQLLVGPWPALGASGLVFVLFGVVWGARRRVRPFRVALAHPALRLVMTWMIVCLALGLVRQWAMGNAAHLGSYIFGLCVAWGFVQRRGRRAAAWAALGAMAALTVLAVLWQPYTPQWVVWRFEKAYTNKQYAAARAALEPLAGSGHPEALNGLAWLMATAPDAALRDGARAVELAMRACAATRWLDPGVIDTLAAAYAETDQWQKAEATEKLALDVTGEWLGLTQDGESSPSLAQATPEARQMHEIFQENLRKIRNREKIRE